MKKLSLVALSVLISSSAFASAVLLEFTGKPSVTQNNKPLSVKSGAIFVDGVQFSADKKSSAQLMLESGAIIKVAGGQTYRVGDKTTKAQQTGFIQGVQIALNEVKQGGANPTVHGMVKMGKPATGAKKQKVVSSAMFGVAGTYPIYTSIRKPGMPFTLMWSPESKITWTNPVLVVENAQKERIFLEAIKPNQISLDACPCKMGLKPGEKYSWYLGQQNADKVLPRSQRYPFTLLSSKAEAALQTDLKTVEALPLETAFAKDVLKAQVYFKYEMWDEMMKTLRPLHQAGEQNLVSDLLFLGAAHMGLAKEAELYR